MAHTDILAVYALSNAIGKPVQLLFPPLANAFEQSPFTRLLNNDAGGAPLTIMWSSGVHATDVGPVRAADINHFVALRPTMHTNSEPVVVVIVSDDDECQHVVSQHAAEQEPEVQEQKTIGLPR